MNVIKKALNHVLSNKNNYDPKKLKELNIKLLRNPLVDILIRLFWGRNLTKLAYLTYCDKGIQHHYTPHYQHHLKNYKYKRFNLLEIGVGGYENPTIGGSSLRMWKKYFPFAKIAAIDICDKSPLEERRIKIFKGSQVDFDFLDQVLEQVGTPEVIIDDGSHINEHVIETFRYLFPKLKQNGIYIIEDTQTSYWPDYGGTSKDLKNADTMMNFFKSLTDSLNHKEFLIDEYEANYYDKNIVSMHFYHNLIFIYKGENIEESNIVINNKMPHADEQPAEELVS